MGPLQKHTSRIPGTIPGIFQTRDAGKVMETQPFQVAARHRSPGYGRKVGHCRLDWAEPGWSWVGLAGHLAYSCNSCHSCDWGGGASWSRFPGLGRGPGHAPGMGLGDQPGQCAASEKIEANAAPQALPGAKRHAKKIIPIKKIDPKDIKDADIDIYADA
eukprot:gene22734-biopygen1203